MNLAHPISIKKIEPAEVQDLLNMSRQTFFDAFLHLNNPDDMEAYAAKAFTAERLQQELTTTGSSFYWAILQHERVGFIKLNTGQAQTEYQSSNSLEVERLYVTAAHQRKQIGQQLLQFAIAQAQAAPYSFIWLGVWEHNQQAIRLYQRLGFTLCGSHDFMLGTDRQTDLLLRKELPGGSI